MPATKPTLLLAALALSGSGLAATALTAAPASAATDCTDPIASIEVRDASIVLGPGERSAFDLIAVVSLECETDGVDISVTRPSGTDTLHAVRAEARDGFGYWAASEGVDTRLPNSEAGTWTTRATVLGATPYTEAGPRITLKHAARLKANVNPNKVADDGSIQVRGTLQRADWEANRYVPFAGEVDLQRRTAEGQFGTYATTTTASNGSAKVVAPEGGRYRFAYAGSVTTAAATSPVVG